ncbi:protein ImuB [Deinococcus metalli]|uniref:Protein ImuB n=1 Tax=Deinococcus metalli TaxID=1141878 RepID=A0A7W8NPU3_9DEIO|nr:hypothetical protein [Deinococcus metalli]MBB5378319.1 protein ImuB [Deinococcus metalli]GHF59743.1 hypothetical protein GCM10017781_40120 [Deinococcus metalli]
MKATLAALVLDPFALWVAARHAPPGAPVVVTDGGRVLDADAAARAAGVQPGMRVSGALSRLPTLHAVPRSGPAGAAAWSEVLRVLPAFSPHLEVLAPGRALLTLTPAAATQLAAALGGQVGLAGTRELALLAALSAAPGQTVTVHAGEEADFRAALPLRVLGGVGLSAAHVERLGWLGLRAVGELLRWSRAQQAAFLGADYPALRPYLHGAASGGVGAVRPEATVSAALAFDDPLFEPHDLEAALDALAATLLDALGTRRPGRVTLDARVAGLTMSATREPKDDLRVPATLRRALRATLHDADAARYGIEGLEVTLGGLERPAVQGDLWGRAQAQDAAGRAEGRFPGSMRRVRWLDVFSLAPGHHYEWVRVADGQPGAPAPVRATPTPAAAPFPRRPDVRA